MEGYTLGILDRLENAIEKGVNNAFSKVFRSGLKPVDISSALQKVMEESAQPVLNEDTGLEDPNTLVAPNVFVIQVAPTDYRGLDAVGLDRMIEEVERSAVQFADDQGYLLAGPIEVEIVPSEDEPDGTIEISPQTRLGAAAPAAGAAPSPEHPIIDVNGEKWLLTEEVTIIGRSSDADIAVPDTAVSRRHLELRITPHGVIATDLGSTNGLYVEGHKVGAATLVDGNQLTIGRTSIMFWTHAAQE